jgi:hypothetical protein
MLFFLIAQNKTGEILVASNDNVHLNFAEIHQLTQTLKVVQMIRFL